MIYDFLQAEAEAEVQIMLQKLQHIPDALRRVSLLEMGRSAEEDAQFDQFLEDAMRDPTARLSKIIYAHLLKSYIALSERIMGYMDVDKDGFVSQAEFAETFLGATEAHILEELKGDEGRDVLIAEMQQVLNLWCTVATGQILWFKQEPLPFDRSRPLPFNPNAIRYGSKYYRRAFAGKYRQILHSRKGGLVHCGGPFLYRGVDFMKEEEVFSTITELEPLNPSRYPPVPPVHHPKSCTTPIWHRA